MLGDSLYIVLHNTIIIEYIILHINRVLNLFDQNLNYITK